MIAQAIPLHDLNIDWTEDIAWAHEEVQRDRLARGLEPYKFKPPRIRKYRQRKKKEVSHED